MKPVLAAVALIVVGAVPVRAAEVFACSGLGCAVHDGRVELDCKAPVTGHWTKLGEHISALVYYTDKPDGLHVVVTTQQGVREKATVRRFETVLAKGQSTAVSIPRASSANH